MICDSIAMGTMDFFDPIKDFLHTFHFVYLTYPGLLLVLGVFTVGIGVLYGPKKIKKSFAKVVSIEGKSEDKM